MGYARAIQGTTYQVINASRVTLDALHAQMQILARYASIHTHSLMDTAVQASAQLVIGQSVYHVIADPYY
jgi:hypothetical protein